MLEWFQARKWQIVMIRLPVGTQMREVEDKLPEALKPARLAAELHLPFIDYNQDARTRDFKTLDESHLTPDSARKIAPILAADLARLRQ